MVNVLCTAVTIQWMHGEVKSQGVPIQISKESMEHFSFLIGYCF